MGPGVAQSSPRVQARLLQPVSASWGHLGAELPAGLKAVEGLCAVPSTLP